MDEYTASTLIIPAAMRMLPARMSCTASRAMLLAIAMQESGDFRARIQLRGDSPRWWDSSGPARGWWQFERPGGVAGVLEHRTTGPMIREVIKTLGYPDDPSVLHAAIAFDDLLACCFARLLLFTVPQALPGPSDHAEGWRQYEWAWRPGKPHPERWPDRYARAWKAAQHD